MNLGSQAQLRSLLPECPVKPEVVAKVPTARGATYVRLVHRVTSKGDTKRVLLVVNTADLLLCNPNGETTRRIPLAEIEGVMRGATDHPKIGKCAQVLIRPSPQPDGAAIDMLLILTPEEANLPPCTSDTYLEEVLQTSCRVLHGKQIVLQEVATPLNPYSNLRKGSRGSSIFATSRLSAQPARAASALGHDVPEVRTEGSSDIGSTLPAPAGGAAGGGGALEGAFHIRHKATQCLVTCLPGQRQLVMHLSGKGTPSAFVFEGKEGSEAALLVCVGEGQARSYVHVATMPHPDGTKFPGLYAPEGQGAPEDVWQYDAGSGVIRHLASKMYLFPYPFTADGVTSAFLALCTPTEDLSNCAFELVQVEPPPQKLKAENLRQQSALLSSGKKDARPVNTDRSSSRGGVPPADPSPPQPASLADPSSPRPSSPTPSSSVSCITPRSSDKRQLQRFESGYASFFQKHDTSKQSDSRRHARHAIGREGSAYRELLNAYPKASIRDADFLRGDTIGEARRELRRLRKMIDPAQSPPPSQQGRAVSSSLGDSSLPSRDGGGGAAKEGNERGASQRQKGRGGDGGGGEKPPPSNKYLVSLTERSAQRKEMESMQQSRIVVAHPRPQGGAAGQRDDRIQAYAPAGGSQARQSSHAAPQQQQHQPQQQQQHQHHQPQQHQQHRQALPQQQHQEVPQQQQQQQQQQQEDDYHNTLTYQSVSPLMAASYNDVSKMDPLPPPDRGMGGGGYGSGSGGGETTAAPGLGPKRDSLYAMGWAAGRASPHRQRPLPVSPLAPFNTQPRVSFGDGYGSAPAVYEETKYMTQRTSSFPGPSYELERSEEATQEPAGGAEGQWPYIDRYNG